MFFKFQTVVTAFKENEKAYILVESLVSLSLISMMLIYLLPIFSQSLIKIEEGKEGVEVVRTMYEQSYSNQDIHQEVESGSYRFLVEKQGRTLSISNHDQSRQESIRLEAIRPSGG